MQYMVEKAFAHHDLDWRYLGLDVEPERLDDAVRGMRAMGFRGGNAVPPPHQQAILPLLDRVSESATLIGSVNLITREDESLVGDNTEGRAALVRLWPLVDRPVNGCCCWGTGTTACAGSFELAAAGIAELRVMDPEQAHAEPLAATLAEKFAIPTTALPVSGELTLPDDVDLVLNAIPANPHDPAKRIAVVAASLRPELVVVDASGDTQSIRLLRNARQCGCKTVDGLAVFIEQVVLALSCTGPMSIRTAHSSRSGGRVFGTVSHRTPGLFITGTDTGRGQDVRCRIDRCRACAGAIGPHGRRVQARGQRLWLVQCGCHCWLVQQCRWHVGNASVLEHALALWQAAGSPGEFGACVRNVLRPPWPRTWRPVPKAGSSNAALLRQGLHDPSATQ